MVTVMVAKAREDDSGMCCVHTLNDQLQGQNTTVTFNPAHISPKASEKSEKWSAYIRGVIALFQRKLSYSLTPLPPC